MTGVITKDIEKNIAKLHGCFTSRTDILLRKLIAKRKSALPTWKIEFNSKNNLKNQGSSLQESCIDWSTHHCFNNNTYDINNNYEW